MRLYETRAIRHDFGQTLTSTMTGGTICIPTTPVTRHLWPSAITEVGSYAEYAKLSERSSPFLKQELWPLSP